MARASGWRMSQALAEIRLLGHHGRMMVEPDVELLESLHAAAAGSEVVHFDICTVYSEGPDYGCTCGVPSLLRELAELLPLPAGASQPYRPAWTPATSAA